MANLCPKEAEKTLLNSSDWLRTLIFSCGMPLTCVLFAVTQTQGVIHHVEYILLLYHPVK